MTAVQAYDVEVDETPVPALTLTDRCDRCGAQAQVRWNLRAGDLLFCGHHSRAYATALDALLMESQAG